MTVSRSEGTDAFIEALHAKAAASECVTLRNREIKLEVRVCVFICTLVGRNREAVYGRCNLIAFECVCVPSGDPLPRNRTPF